jgi:hypothetical protein
MQALPALEVPPYQPQQYRGISRRGTAVERRIDTAYLSGDVDATISAVVDHVKTFATRAKYLRKANVEANLPLADRVGMIVLRSLPGYQGPQAPLKTYDGRVPLSSFVNLKLKQAHLDLCREHDAIRRREVLEAELLAGDEDFDLLSLMAERPQSECMETRLIVNSFLETLTDRERGRLGSAAVVGKAREWANSERPGARQHRITRCQCWDCTKRPPSRSQVGRMIEKHRGILTTYALFQYQGIARRPVTHSHNE